MKKRYLLGIIMAGFLLSGCYHEGGTSSQAPIQTDLTVESDAQKNGEGITVKYTSSGFTPNSVTVKTGTTVTFVNESSKNMWVASSVHPTHKDLPSFDQLSSSGKGTSYSYVFDKAGEWSYHNHRSAGHIGKVVVE